MTVPTFTLRNLNKQYENETPEQRSARYAANVKRTREFLDSWKKFEREHPELAKNMVC